MRPLSSWRQIITVFEREPSGFREHFAFLCPKLMSFLVIQCQLINLGNISQTSLSFSKVSSRLCVLFCAIVLALSMKTISNAVSGFWFSPVLHVSLTKRDNHFLWNQEPVKNTTTKNTTKLEMWGNNTAFGKYQNVLWYANVFVSCKNYVSLKISRIQFLSHINATKTVNCLIKSRFTGGCGVVVSAWERVWEARYDGHQHSGCFSHSFDHSAIWLVEASHFDFQ